MTRLPRILSLFAVLPLLAACEVPSEAVVQQPAPVFPAPAPQPAPAPAPTPAAAPAAPLQRPASVSTTPISSAPAPEAAPAPASAPAPAPGAVTASAPRETISAPPAVLSALLPGTPPSAVFQNGDGCYLFSIERTEPLSGYPVRDESGAPLCENDDGSVGPRPAS